MSRHNSSTKHTLDEAIWDVVRRIPSGSVATYGQVAELAGLPRGARRVGAALKAAPPGARLPWHRVINAQGKIALPVDSDGYARQRCLLKREGVNLVNGRVDMTVYGWRQPLDALLWGPQ